MKKLLRLTKLLLTAALFGVGQSAWATDVPYTIGSEGCGYRAEYSDPYTVKNGETLHITFTNNNYGTATVFHNYILEATSAVDKHDGVYFDLRGDNYAFGQGTFVQNYNGNCLSDLNGATVDNYITYAGGVITVNQIFTKAEVTTYNRVYTYTVAGNPKSVIIYVTEEAAQVTITNVETSKWSTVWSTDFSSAPSGISYSHPNATVSITDGKLLFYNGSNSDRTATVSFDDDAFEVATNWIMEYDWGASSPNTNSTTLNFVTDQGTAFSIAYDKYDGTATITSSTSTELTTTLPINNYPKAAPSTISHFKIEGVTDDGIYLTLTCGGVTYVNKQKVTSSFGYPTTFTGSTGKAQNYISFDNISFKTPAVAGFVATPTSEVRADGTNRKFTLSCLTDGATIYYATSDLEKGAAGWIEYTGEVSTAAATIYAYAKDDEDNTSEIMNFATGAGTAITLNAPTFSVTSLAEDGGYYYPIVTISNNQTGLELTPASTTLTYKFNDASIASSNPYTFTTVGTLEVIVSADGFTSNSATFEIEYPYVKTKTIDLQAITASELSSSWKLMAENTGLQGSWSSPYNGTTYSRYWYDVTEESASRITLVDGLEGWYQNSDGANKSYYIYPGLGLVVPLTTQKDDGTENGGSNYGSNNHAIYLAGGTADQYVTWKYGNNYGKYADKTTVTAGNVSFNLYRYSDILTKVEAYSPAVSVTLPSSGYATFASDYALDFANATGVKAYYATNDLENDGKINMTKITGSVPAGTGLFLQKDGEGAVSIPVVASSTTDMSANLLKRGTGAVVKSVDNGITCYVLANQASGIGFYKLDTTTGVVVSTNKAYLELPASVNPSRLAFVFDDGEATGIKNVAPVNAENEDAIYNLSGQRVSQPKKGLYVVGGKKVMVK